MDMLTRYSHAGSQNAPMAVDPNGDWVRFHEVNHRLAELCVAQDGLSELESELEKAKKEIAKLRNAAKAEKAPKAELPKAKKSRVPISKKK